MSASAKRVHIYGWRQISVLLPRVWKWGLSVTVRVLPPRLSLGIYGQRDAEEGVFNVLIGLGLVEVDIWPMRFLTKREVRERRDQFAAEWGPRTADEAAEYLRGQLR